MDSFNPFHLKTAKQSVSSTGIWLFCLNFPLHLRFLEENVCFVGVVPGPGKPSLDQINHVLDLIVDVFQDFWVPGVHYTRTFKKEFGRLAQAILIASLSDMLAARQAAGLSSSTSRRFCTGCGLEIRDIENIDKKSWPPRTAAEHVRCAIKWRDAVSEEERDAAFEEHGVRWSPLLRLPYWNPIHFTVTETSHLFFLGLVAHHCRKAFRIDRSSRVHFSSISARILISAALVRNISSCKRLWNG
ncbi:hypothetical protein DENSPDRAFT_861003 [Dentipellis sp. KUC8613]|nr:hypothetical protein DENSPDRAFT_861003 [Dentipellis sp. KUC8613]